MATLAEVLEVRTVQAAPELVEPIDRGRLRCHACGHACPIPDGAAGVCKVRFNRGGVLHVPYGYVGGVQCDPIEKKPFFHAHPGALAFSFGMLGCDLHCCYCQNWVTSQALRDPQAVAPPRDTSPAVLVADASRLGARVVVSTYNEPLITSEWAVAIFKEARARGLMTAFVSNGNATPRVLELHSAVGGSLQSRSQELRRPALSSAWRTSRAHPRDDSRAARYGNLAGDRDAPHSGLQRLAEELDRLTSFVAGVSPDIPWHVTAFHKDYRMTDPENTTPEMLVAAAAIGQRNGLRYVYAGNAPGLVGDLENTRCHYCRALLVERDGYHVSPLPADGGGLLPGLRDADPGPLGARLRGPDQRDAVPAREFRLRRI